MRSSVPVRTARAPRRKLLRHALSPQISELLSSSHWLSPINSMLQSRYPSLGSSSAVGWTAEGLGVAPVTKGVGAGVGSEVCATDRSHRRIRVTVTATATTANLGERKRRNIIFLVAVEFVAVAVVDGCRCAHAGVGQDGWSPSFLSR